MAITEVSRYNWSSVSSFVIPITVSGDQPALVLLMAGNTLPYQVQYNGVDFTTAVTHVYATSNSAGIYVLTNPTPGSNTLRVMTSGGYGGCNLMVLNGVDQSNPIADTSYAGVSSDWLRYYVNAVKGGASFSCIGCNASDRQLRRYAAYTELNAWYYTTTRYCSQQLVPNVTEGVDDLAVAYTITPSGNVASAAVTLNPYIPSGGGSVMWW